MPVGDTEREFLLEAKKAGLTLRNRVALPWLTGKGHIEANVTEVEEAILTRLRAIFAELGGNEAQLQAKRAMALPVDFLLEGQVIVELDEYQHFTSARLRTLDLYGGIPHGLDLDEYRRLCRRLRQEADSYRRAKQTADFPFAGGRSAQRAYFDAVRDLLGPAMGYRVVRIPAVWGSSAKLVANLKSRLAP